MISSICFLLSCVITINVSYSINSYKFTSNIVTSITLKNRRIQGRGAEGEEKSEIYLNPVNVL